MRTLMPLNKTPKHFDGLYTLNVWTSHGTLMRKCHEINNGGNSPYVHSFLWDSQERRSGNDTILASLRDPNQKKLILRVNDNRQNSYTLTAAVALASVVPEVESAWVLLLVGKLQRHHGGEGILETDVRVASYFDSGNDRGFCLLPELARHELGALN